MTTTTVPTLLKIVTVEDSSLIVSRMKEMLDEISGVAFAGNAESIPVALELLETVNPDVLILDINLGSRDTKNGIDLLFDIRKIYPEMKIIMLTNLTDKRYRDLCEEGGADFFFDKSNDFDRIPDTLVGIIKDRKLFG